MIKIFEKNKGLSIFTTILIAIGIFIISSIPSSGTGIAGKNKLAILYHFFAFFFFTLFLLISTIKNKKPKYIPSIAISIIYAVLDEIHQYFVPGRVMSSGDIVTDSLGIFAATLGYYLYKKFKG